MRKVDIARAWKDAKYRRSLTRQELDRLPPNPAGLVELTDDELKTASGLAGGADRPILTTAPTCTLFTFLNWRACGCGPLTTAPTCTVHTFNGWKACCPG